MTIGLAALRIAIIDDNAQMRTIVGSVLTAAGIRDLHYAPDGRSGLDMIRAVQPDLCYVDYEMPQMNGLDFVSAVRSDDSALRFLPLIMLTGHSDRLRLTAARDRGVNEFLCKPVSARTILSRLRTLIHKPRPFVDAPGFFGPERRRRDSAAYAGVKRRASDAREVLRL